MRKIAFLIGILILVQCQSEQPIPEFDIPKQNQAYEVTLSEIEKVAANFWQKQTQKNQRGKSVKLDKVITVMDNNQPSFYIINYLKGGFVIVSSDKRTLPILAWSENGEFSSEFSSMNGLNKWIEDTKGQMRELRSSNIDQNSIAISEWNSLIENQNASDQNGRGTAVENTSCEEWYTIGQYMCQNTTVSRGPLAATTWGQSGISNGSTPAYSDCTCGRNPAGCGAVAMAQVLRVLRPNNSFNYLAMPNTSNYNCNLNTIGEFELARLMLECGIQANSQYYFFGCNTMTLPWNIPGALQNMGLSNGGSISNFTPSIIETEITLGSPIIFYAADAITNWHIWICDGFIRNNYSQYNCNTGYCDSWSYTYFHMNWGWSGASNGWYASGNFVPNGTSLNYNNQLKMIKGIRI